MRVPFSPASVESCAAQIKGMPTGSDYAPQQGAGLGGMCLPSMVRQQQQGMRNADTLKPVGANRDEAPSTLGRAAAPVVPGTPPPASGPRVKRAAARAVVTQADAYDDDDDDYEDDYADYNKAKKKAGRKQPIKRRRAAATKKDVFDRD